MSTSKCEKSEHRKEIDEAAKSGMSARKISEMLLVKFNEHMSHTAGICRIPLFITTFPVLNP
jgi:hypothetical protein